MSKLIQDEKSIHILHTLNYNQIRDGLFNIIKWHDSGDNRYTLASKDITDSQGTKGKEITLGINDTAGYVVTYLRSDNPVDPVIIIERYAVDNGVCTRSNLSDTDHTDKTYDILCHVEKIIKNDIQRIGETLAVTP